MSKTTKFITILTENKVQLLITLFSVAIAVVNFLVVSKLAPVSQDLAVISTRVNALESREIVAKDEWVRRNDTVDKRFDALDKRLERLDNTQDRILEIISNRK